MKLIIEKGEIELPEDFSFEIEVNNPFFSDDGSTSVPADLPGTRHNLRLLGNPDRPALSNRYMRTFPALLQHGVFQRKCNLIVDAFTSEEGVSASLAFAESDMYASIQDKQLKDIFKDKYHALRTNQSTLDIIADNVRTLSNIYRSQTALLGDVVIFPVAVDKYENGYSYINEPTGSEAAFEYTGRTITTGGDTVSVPYGYGVTAFFWLRVMIRKTFELCGYKVVQNDFDKNPFRFLVVLNNCADAICKKKGIHDADMVPSITVGELINWLKDKFGAAVAVKHDEVRIILIQNNLSEYPDMDITEYMRDATTVSYPENSRVVLSCDTSLEGANAPAENLSDFYKTHPVVKNKLNAPSGRLPPGTWYNPVTGQYTNNTSSKVNALGSNCFKYDRMNSTEIEEHSADDRYVPEVIMDNDLPAPYIGERLHYNTSINGIKEEDKQYLQACWAIYNDKEKHWIGNTQPYASSTQAMPLVPALTPDGLYDVCWKKYNELLLNSAPVIEALIDYPESLLMSIDLMMPKFLNGQSVMIKSFSFEVSDTGIRCGKSKILLLPNYQDAIVDAHLDFWGKPTGYGWKIKNDLEAQLVGERSCDLETEILQPEDSDHLQDYTMQDAPATAPEYVGQKEKLRLRKTYFQILDLGAQPTGREFWVYWHEWFEAYLIFEDA